MEISFLHAVSSVRNWNDYLNLMKEPRTRKANGDYIIYV